MRSKIKFLGVRNGAIFQIERYIPVSPNQTTPIPAPGILRSVFPVACKNRLLELVLFIPAIQREVLKSAASISIPKVMPVQACRAPLGSKSRFDRLRQQRQALDGVLSAIKTLSQPLNKQDLQPQSTISPGLLS